MANLYKMKQIFDEHSDNIIDYLRQRVDKLGQRQLKGENEFSTIWNVAENDGRKRELLDLIKDIETITHTKYERQ